MPMNGIKAQNKVPVSEATTMLGVSWQVVRSNEECNKIYAAIQSNRCSVFLSLPNVYLIRQCVHA